MKDILHRAENDDPKFGSYENDNFEEDEESTLLHRNIYGDGAMYKRSIRGIEDEKSIYGATGKTRKAHRVPGDKEAESSEEDRTDEAESTPGMNGARDDE